MDDLMYQLVLFATNEEFGCANRPSIQMDMDGVESPNKLGKSKLPAIRGTPCQDIEAQLFKNCESTMSNPADDGWLEATDTMQQNGYNPIVETIGKMKSIIPKSNFDIPRLNNPIGGFRNDLSDEAIQKMPGALLEEENVKNYEEVRNITKWSSGHNGPSRTTVAQKKGNYDSSTFMPTNVQKMHYMRNRIAPSLTTSNVNSRNSPAFSTTTEPGLRKLIVKVHERLHRNIACIKNSLHVQKREIDKLNNNITQLNDAIKVYNLPLSSLNQVCFDDVGASKTSSQISSGYEHVRNNGYLNDSNDQSEQMKPIHQVQNMHFKPMQHVQQVGNLPLSNMMTDKRITGPQHMMHQPMQPQLLHQQMQHQSNMNFFQMQQAQSKPPIAVSHIVPERGFRGQQQMYHKNNSFVNNGMQPNIQNPNPNINVNTQIYSPISTNASLLQPLNQHQIPSVVQPEAVQNSTLHYNSEAWEYKANRNVGGPPVFVPTQNNHYVQDQQVRQLVQQEQIQQLWPIPKPASARGFDNFQK